MPNALWSLPLPNSSCHQANGIILTDKPKLELSTYLYATLYRPVPSTTLLGAIFAVVILLHIQDWPPISSPSIYLRVLPPFLVTKIRKPSICARHKSLLLMLHTRTAQSRPQTNACSSYSHHIFTMLFEKDHVMKSYSDQTGRFPVPSSRSNHYIFALYHYTTPTPSMRLRFLIVTPPASAMLNRELSTKGLYKKAMLLLIFTFSIMNADKNSLFCEIQHRLPPCASQRTSSQCYWKSHSNFQE